MANQEHLNLLRQGTDVWNTWLEQYREIRPDFRGADLREADLTQADLREADLSNTHLWRANLTQADLRGADLREADLRRTTLWEANLSNANLSNANLWGAHLGNANLSNATLSEVDLSDANLWRANLSHATLSRADLRRTNLWEANLSNANLSNANLSMVILARTNLHKATLTNCWVYGISVWDVNLAEADQSNLIITDPFSNEQTITVDNLKVAQFIYLLLNNQEIRDVIDTIGQKGVLILGRFSKERKLVLDALREKLRALNFLPIVFDFERPTERDFTETVMTLAGLSCFIIADITNPKSSPLELQATVPDYMIPFVPLIQKGEQPFSMFKDLKSKYNWVLDPLAYDTPSNLIKVLEIAVVKPALEKRAELLAKKVEQLRVRDIDEFINKIPDGQ